MIPTHAKDALVRAAWVAIAAGALAVGWLVLDLGFALAAAVPAFYLALAGLELPRPSPAWMGAAWGGIGGLAGEAARNVGGAIELSVVGLAVAVCAGAAGAFLFGGAFALARRWHGWRPAGTADARLLAATLVAVAAVGAARTALGALRVPPPHDALGAVYLGGLALALAPLLTAAHARVFGAAAAASRRERRVRGLIQAWPHLACPRHATRPRRTRRALLYLDVRCRVAGCTAELRTGVREVCGRIGDPAAGWPPPATHGTLHVNLWDEEARKARNADVDRIEIAAGPGVADLDWAVSAVVNELRNDAGRPPGALARVGVTLVGDPPLSANVRRLLEGALGPVTAAAPRPTPAPPPVARRPRRGRRRAAPSG